jgi:anti-sigma28 factor (negative regulator of flagellin synthesis)
MTATPWTIEETVKYRAARNAALVAAEAARHRATHEAEVEYSETVHKLRERFESDLAEANRLRIARVTPAHRDYNRAVVAAERRH